MTSTKALRVAGVLLLFALPLVLRLMPLGHGGERGYVPDAHMVRQALGMARDKDLAPPVGRYSTYPNLVPYLLLPCYAAQFAVGEATGAWSGAEEYGAHVLEHPQHAAWVARALVALMGAATAWVAYRAARAAGMRAGAHVAAWLVATGLLHVQLSTHERPWVPMVLFLSLSAWAAIAYAGSARRVHLVLSGACAGLAFACHQSGLGALAIPFCAWLLGPLAWNGRALLERALGGVLAVAAFALAGILLGHPYLLVHGRTPDASVVGQGQADVSIGGMSLVLGARWESVARLSVAALGYDPVLVLLGLGGLVLALRHRRLRPVAVFTLAWAAFFLTSPNDHVRYLLPVLVLLALPAGLLAERWLAKPAGRIAVPLLLAVPLVQGLRLDWLLLQPDTRALAELRLARSPAGGRVAIDRYGPLVEPDRAGLAVLERVRATCGESLRPRELHRKRLLEDGEVRGVDAIRVEELLETDEREGSVRVRTCLAGELGADPRAALARLGATHLCLVDRRPGDGRPSLLAAGAPVGAPVWRIDPAWSPARPAREAFLPTEMDFPLSGLWSVERPGPLLELVPAGP